MEPENVTPHTAPAAPEGWQQKLEIAAENNARRLTPYSTRFQEKKHTFIFGAEWAESYFAAEINLLKERLAKATPNYNNAKKQNENY
jgi:hypothetical protein